MTDHEVALVLPTEAEVELLGHDAEAAKGYAERSLSDATRDAYRSDIAIFRNWCERRGVQDVPASPEAVASFVASQAEQGLKPSTISRRLAAVRMLHRASRPDAKGFSAKPRTPPVRPVATLAARLQRPDAIAPLKSPPRDGRAVLSPRSAPDLFPDSALVLPKGVLIALSPAVACGVIA